MESDTAGLVLLVLVGPKEVPPLRLELEEAGRDGRPPPFLPPGA